MIHRVTFLKEQKDHDFLWKVLPMLKQIKLEKGDVLYWPEEHSEESKKFVLINLLVFFIMRGILKLYT